MTESNTLLAAIEWMGVKICGKSVCNSLKLQSFPSANRLNTLDDPFAYGWWLFGLLVDVELKIALYAQFSIAELLQQLFPEGGLGRTWTGEVTCDVMIR